MVPPALHVVGLEDLGIIEEILEDGATLKENSRIKADYVFNRTGMAVFADDSGLIVDALGGAPGIHSARYAGPDKNNQANVELLLQRLEEKNNRQAHFLTVITFIDAQGRANTFEGRVDGHILTLQRGSGGFGYDPVFVPVGFENTFAEMNPAAKNSISHRGRAFKKLVSFLLKNYG